LLRRRRAGGRRPAGALWAAYVGLYLFGAGLLVIALSHRAHRWAPPPLPAASAVAGAWPAAGDRAEMRGVRGLPRSVPVTVRIPAIGVTATIISVGLNGRGGVAAPPLTAPMLAGWYDRGAAPGQAGAAVLLGHVDSAATGPAVFYKLGALVRGDLIYVTRKDGRTAEFQVTSVAVYPAADFPERRVYGFTPGPALRLVTCGGDFNGQTRHYLDRTIVFARYVAQSRFRN